MVKVGDKKKFLPTAYKQSNGLSEHFQKVEGVVTYVNYPHRWYRVEYETKYFGKQHECFKF